MSTIHWFGTGLSAIPGLRRLIQNGHSVAVYNRTVSKAEIALADCPPSDGIHTFDIDRNPHHFGQGDVIVSMLPGEWHVPLAEACIEAGAHFVSSSYISPEMRNLDDQAKQAGVCLVNEVGLDPGIDHIFAHALVNAYQSSPQFDPNNKIHFTSYCGGLSQIPNDFRYKFSWSPLGVLRALKSPSVSIRDGVDYHVTKPWEAVEDFTLPMPWGEETFEVYPNRDSRPFMAQYHFAEDWQVQNFVRGTLRYAGWKDAWQNIFTRIDEDISDPELVKLSDQLWQDYAFEDDEKDRVVLTVNLRADNNDGCCWNQSFLLDAIGDERGSAMARLVSVPVSLAVEGVLTGESGTGVSAAPSDSEVVTRWLMHIASLSEKFCHLNHLE